jgi:hypothetical protein
VGHVIRNNINKNRPIRELKGKGLYGRKGGGLKIEGGIL